VLHTNEGHSHQLWLLQAFVSGFTRAYALHDLGSMRRAADQIVSMLGAMSLSVQLAVDEQLRQEQLMKEGED